MLSGQETDPTCSTAPAACTSCNVRPSVTFVDSVETNKRIFKKISPLGSHTILVFPDQTSWQYSDRDPLPASNAGGVGKNRDFDKYLTIDQNDMFTYKRSANIRAIITTLPRRQSHYTASQSMVCQLVAGLICHWTV